MPCPERSDDDSSRPSCASVQAGFRIRDRWYAIQVTAGREDCMCAEALRAVALEERLCSERVKTAAGRHASSSIAREIFVPKARVGVKQGDKWLPGEETLLPGYLIAVTDDPARLAVALGRVGGVARLVKQDNVFVPLPRESVEWMERHTQRGAIPVEMSEGYVEKGTLHVTSGPLAGREAQVVKVDHRRKRAYLELEMFGRTITAQLGIRITRNRNCKKSRSKTE